MTKKRIEYKIGLSKNNNYCVDYTMLSDDCNKNSELFKVWILHFYKIIYNYGDLKNENVIELFNFLLHMKNLKHNESLKSLIVDKYGKYSVVNIKECAMKIEGETFDIINSGVGVNISFPLKANHNDIKTSVIVLSLFIWEQLNGQDAKELFKNISSDVFDTRNDSLLNSLQGNVILPNKIIEKYSDEIDRVGRKDLEITKESNERPLDEVKQMNEQIDDENSQYISNHSSEKKDKTRNGFYLIIIGFILGVILTLITTTTHFNISADKVEDEYGETNINDGETYLEDGETYLNEVMLKEVKAEAHILDWGYAVFDIYNGTEYTIEAVVIEISILNENGEVVEIRKYRQNALLRINPYSTEEIEFKTGITGVGQVSDDDNHIPDNLVSWKFVEIIVGN